MRQKQEDYAEKRERRGAEGTHPAEILLFFLTLNILIQDSNFIGLHMKKIFLKWLKLWLTAQM